jgi:hypothetical protein
MAAGHALLTILVAFGVGTVLNADSMMRTAEGLPLGSTKRSIAVSVMRPVRAVADALQITRPRDRLDTALGKTPTEVDDPIEAFPTTTSTRPAVGPTTSTAPRTDVRRQPTEDAPLRVYVAGDSLAFAYGTAMGRLAAGHPLVETVGEVDYHVATGLARPDKLAWPAQLDEQMTAREPDVVVLMLGSNDDQAVTSPDGATHGFGTAGWQDEYRRRVASVMDQVISTGRDIVSVGVPIFKNAARNPRYQLINRILAQEARRRPAALYVNAYELLQDDAGQYAQYLPDGGGGLVKIRANDGIHLERAGGDRLAQQTLEVMRRIYPRL